jgi:hypothetical protein
MRKMTEWATPESIDRPECISKAARKYRATHAGANRLPLEDYG